jgi:hypothetical protein
MQAGWDFCQALKNRVRNQIEQDYETVLHDSGCLITRLRGGDGHAGGGMQTSNGGSSGGDGGGGGGGNTGSDSFGSTGWWVSDPDDIWDLDPNHEYWVPHVDKVSR